MSLLRRGRRWLVPEVVQTSAMDCGPAVLKCLLEGFGIPVHYGRLREACQTDVDGTSIDTLEEVARQLGLDAEQVMLPVDHLLLAESAALPAILVVRQPNGFTHFVLVWRRHGPFVQVMDPGEGRRWLTCKQLLEEVYVHTHQVPAAAWHEWAQSEGFQRALAQRLRALGEGRGPLEEATAAADWRPLAALDAATRLVASLVQAGGIRRGREARGILAALTSGAAVATPDAFWSVRPAPAGPDGEEQLHLRGAVLIQVRGRLSDESAEAPAPPSAELAAALAEPATPAGHTLLRLLHSGSLLSWLVLGAALVLAAGSVVLEALLLRAALDLGRELGLVEQRLQAAGFLLLFGVVLLCLELHVGRGLLRLGRRLEVRLRAAFLEKIPRLHDRYFQSRPISDMAERSHSLHQLRILPRLAGQFVRATLTLGLTAGVLAWIDPPSTVLAVGAAAVAVALPLLFLPFLAGLDLRVRTHAGALSRFYLDALLGLATVRAHSAERAVRREHESLLVEWALASRRLLLWVVILEGLQVLAGFGLAGWLLLAHAGRVADSGAALLLAYWALNLPVLGEEIVLLVRQYPLHRNVTLRLLEPLGAPVEESVSEASQKRPEAATLLRSVANGVSITFESVTVRAAGHTILRDVDLHLDAGSHVAVVGASGSGKSTLVGLLLGWHRPAAGRILIDGAELDATRLDTLRRETAWVDPAVQLWNRSLVENLLYGVPDGEARELGDVLRDADLHSVLRRLPEGLQTALGEGGGLLSGGEGQRVRYGRGLERKNARLVILDEPFRGLDREKRRLLLQRARVLWPDATLLCITHDVGETLDFERVLVLDAAQVVEDGSPAQLAEDQGSHYRRLLDAEEAVRTGLWSSAQWRRLRLETGCLQEAAPGGRS